MKNDKEQRYRAPALDKGLDILELLALQPSGMTRSEIVKAMGKGPSEIYRMIERLVARDYVSRSLEGDRYALTMKLFHLGSAFPPLNRLIKHTQPLMDAFSAQSMQSVHLAVEDMGQAFVVAQASSQAAWEFRLRIGAMMDLLETSSGQTLLAFSGNDPLIQTLLAKCHHPPTKLADELRTIRDNGYRLGASRQLVGVIDISVPVQAANGTTVAVLTCPFLPRVTVHQEDQEVMDVQATLALLQQTAQRASAT